MKRAVGLGAITLQLLGLLFVGWMAWSALHWEGSENFGRLGSLFYGLPISHLSFLLGILAFAVSDAFSRGTRFVVRGAAILIPLASFALSIIGIQG